MTSSNGPLLSVRSLSIDFWDEEAWVNIVNRVSFSIQPGETLGLAGESGCGKTTTACAVMAYTRPRSRIREGEVVFQERDLLKLQDRDLRRIRGADIAMVAQNPATALSPAIRVGAQVREVLDVHQRYQGGGRAERRILELFEDVRLPEPAEIARRYPHQLSGGQQQRVAIAMALACDPTLLLLDEPTSDLDVTTQAQLLNLLMQLQAEHGMAVMYVTHNLGVLAQISDRLAVMYAGELVEVAPTKEVYENPYHPYTMGLIAAVPRISAPMSLKTRLRGFLQRDQLPVGCRFAPRCDYASPECFEEPQVLVEASPNHWVACRGWQEVIVRDEAVIGTNAGA